jgi:hypothetical protein
MAHSAGNACSVEQTFAGQTTCANSGHAIVVGFNAISDDPIANVRNDCIWTAHLR